MALEIKETLLKQVRSTGIKPSRALEIGGVAKALLTGPEGGVLAVPGYVKDPVLVPPRILGHATKPSGPHKVA